MPRYIIRPGARRNPSLGVSAARSGDFGKAGTLRPGRQEIDSFDNLVIPNFVTELQNLQSQLVQYSVYEYSRFLEDVMNRQRDSLGLYINRVLEQASRSGRVTTAGASKRAVGLGVNFATQRIGSEIINAAATNATGDVAETLGIIGRVYKEAVRSRRGTAIKYNRIVAQEAINATTARYIEVRNARSKSLNSIRSNYRSGERDSGGRLLGALASPLMAEATIDGVLFLNTTLLDTTARQWARLNFGAGARAKDAPAPGMRPTSTRNYTSRFLADAVGTPITANPNGQAYSLKHWSPSPAFKIPVGFWRSDGKNVPADVTRRGLDQFYPIDKSQAQALRGKISEFTEKNAGKKVGDRVLTKSDVNRDSFAKFGVQRKKVTAGIAAWNFLDAGMASIAHNFPIAVSAFLQEVFRESQQQVGAGIPGKQAVEMNQINSAMKGFEAQMNAFSKATGNVGDFRQRFLAGLSSIK